MCEFTADELTNITRKMEETIKIWFGGETITLNRGTEAEEKRSLSTFFKVSRIQPDEDQSILFRENVHNNKIAFLLDGVAKCSYKGIHICYISPGEVIGEIEFVNNTPGVATVQITKPSTVLLMDFTQYESSLKEACLDSVHFVRMCLAKVSSRLKDNNDLFYQLRNKQCLPLVVGKILDQMYVASDRCLWRLDKVDSLAEELGYDTQSVYKALNKLKQKCLIFKESEESGWPGLYWIPEPQKIDQDYRK